MHIRQVPPKITPTKQWPHALILISNNSVFDYHSNGMERPISFTYSKMYETFTTEQII